MMNLADWINLYKEDTGGTEKSENATMETGINDTWVFKTLLNFNNDIAEQRSQIKKQEEILLKQEDFLKVQKNQIKLHIEQIENLRNDIEKQKNRIPEIIGLFSAIISLVLIDVSIIKSASTFLAAILLISSLTCSIAIFAVLIHTFFASEDKIKFGKLFWTPIGFLVAFILLGIWAYFEKIDLYQIKNEMQTSIQVNGNAVNYPK